MYNIRKLSVTQCTLISVNVCLCVYWRACRSYCSIFRLKKPTYCRNKSNLHSRCGPKLSCIFKFGQAYDAHGQYKKAAQPLLSRLLKTRASEAWLRPCLSTKEGRRREPFANLKDLQNVIRDKWHDIDDQTVRKAILQWKRRLVAVAKQNVGPIQHIFTARCYASAVLAMGLCPCLSQVGVLLKRLNAGSHKQHHDSPGTTTTTTTTV